jgi:phosphate starvation-inducible membrane PsiE
VSGSTEQITSPDQRKPISRKAARVGAVLTAIILLLMTIGNHEGHVEDVFLVATAALLILVVLGDWLLRKNGLRR